MRPNRASLSRDGRASDGGIHPDNRLAFADHGLFAVDSAIGVNRIIQCLCVYEHPIDFDGLRRFHRNLGRGLLGRRIERSSLWFAQHRWVSERPPDIDIAPHPRPRADLSDWADERAQLPIDPERGSGWRLGVLPFTDGSTAVSLEVSHCLIDGLGLALAIAEAVLGETRDLDYPPPRSCSAIRRVAQDARQASRDAPEVLRALVTAVKLSRRRRPVNAQPASRPAAIRVSPGGDCVVVPSVTIHVDVDDWDSRANALGGTSGTLLAGFAVKLGEHMGRRRADAGTVTLQLPLSGRTEGDNRANPLLLARVSVDPTRVTTDLHDVRVAVKEALRAARETPDEMSHFFALTLLTPRWALKRTLPTPDPDLSVVCSNLGEFDPAVCRIDGTDADFIAARAVGQNFTRQVLERVGGLMGLISWRFGGKVGINVLAFQPGAENTKPALRELAAKTLAEFDLTGEVD